jgi:hypothetical protein
MTTTVALLVLLGMLVVVPLGLPLLATPGLPRLQRAWLVAGALAGASLLLTPSDAVAVLTLPYLAVATAAGALALRRAVLARTTAVRLRSVLRELTALSAGLSLPVAAGSLTAERAGRMMLGFDGEVLALTVAHFHFAGFAVSVLAGLLLVRVPGWTAAIAAAAVPAGTVLVAAGHFLGAGVELAGAVILTTGLLALSVATVRRVRTGSTAGRRLLVVAAACTPLTMALALWWAVGRLTGLPHPDLAVMAATHGAGNAVGVCLCGLLGWRLLRPVPV